MGFRDRVDAGRQLAEQLKRQYLGDKDLVVLGLPRGGVPVAFETAQALGAPLDIIMVRKLGVPFQPELAMGAIGEGGVPILNREVLRLTGSNEAELAMVERREPAELERRARRYRGDHPPWRSMGALQWWSTMASRRARPPGPPARWPVSRGGRPRPHPLGARGSAGADVVDRGRTRRGGARPQPTSTVATSLREPPRSGTRCVASL